MEYFSRPVWLKFSKRHPRNVLDELRQETRGAFRRLIELARKGAQIRCRICGGRKLLRQVLPFASVNEFTAAIHGKAKDIRHAYSGLKERTIRGPNIDSDYNCHGAAKKKMPFTA